MVVTKVENLELTSALGFNETSCQGLTEAVRSSEDGMKVLKLNKVHTEPN